MPGLSGEETYDKIHALYKELPIIIFSGFITPTIERSLNEKGVNGFVHKPFKNMDMLLQIRQTLDENKKG